MCALEETLIWSEGNTTVYQFSLEIWPTDPQLIWYRWHGISDLEFAQAESIANLERRNEFIARRGILRHLLSHYLTCEPKAIDIQVGEFGKPYVKGYPIRYSCSSSGEYGLIGISTEAEIGVDIQKNEDRLVDLEFEFFTDSEKQAIKADPKSSEQFFRISFFYYCSGLITAART